MGWGGGGVTLGGRDANEFTAARLCRSAGKPKVRLSRLFNPHLSGPFSGISDPLKPKPGAGSVPLGSAEATDTS